MAFEINSDKYSFASKPEKSETDYTLTIARQLVAKEAEVRASADTEINRHLNLLDNSEADFRAFEVQTTAFLAEKEILSNKVQSISNTPSEDKYPSEAAVAEYVAGLGEGNGGHVHVNKEVIDTITHERVNRWDFAADNLKDYSVEAMASAVNTLIDRANKAETDISSLSDNIQSIKGYTNRKTVFNSDGSISEISSNNTKVTTFNSDGSVTETDSNGNSKTTLFNPDGSITEVI